MVNVVIKSVRSIKMERYFADVVKEQIREPFKQHHNDLYLTICYYNLYEKYWRGQKNFTEEQFRLLNTFYKSKL